MAVITDRLDRLATRLKGLSIADVLLVGGLAAVVWFTARQDLWPLAVMAVVAFEALSGQRRRQSAKERRQTWLRHVPMVIMGASVAIIIATYARGAAQLLIAVGYAWWRLVMRRPAADALLPLWGLWLVQMMVFEGLFLAEAVWRSPSGIILALLWVCSYALVYVALKQRDERLAGVMAATWAVVVAEASWVFSNWLVTYVLGGGLIMVPQPALVLAGLAYCFGSIYVSQRQGNLSRGRLTEYLLIALIMIAIVVAGTPWRGTL